MKYDQKISDHGAVNGDSAIASERPFVDLSTFDNSDYEPGRGKVVRTIWYFLSLVFFESGWLPVSGVKSSLLRWFGARVGNGVVIKPHVRIKYPWRLTVGDYCWIGQGAWIDNIEDVCIHDNVCISQLVYLCTGSHDHRKVSFDLIAKPIEIHSGAWVGARSLLLGGVKIGANVVVAAGSVVTKPVEAGFLVGGSPAKCLGKR